MKKADQEIGNNIGYKNPKLLSLSALHKQKFRHVLYLATSHRWKSRRRVYTHSHLNRDIP